MTKRLSDFFNASRWIAALIVAIGHVRHLIFVESGRLEHAGLLWKGFYFVTGFGHEGVVVFFIVSGYLVGGLTMGKLRNGFDHSTTLSSGLTPYEYIAKIWTSEPDRFIVNPIHQMPGLNT